MQNMNLALVGMFFIVTLGLPAGALAQQSYTEDFTTTTYMDAVNTTANWDTVAGELRLFPFSFTLAGSYDTPAIARSVAVSGDHAFVADYGSGLQVIHVYQNEVDLEHSVGHSLEVDTGIDAKSHARLTSTQTGSVAWELSANGGANWQGILPDGNWTAMLVPGPDLLWRSTHTWEIPGINPSVGELEIEWLFEAASITSITDVPDDQGGWVYLNFTRSGYDFLGETTLPVSGYNIYKQVDVDKAAQLSDKIPVNAVNLELKTPDGKIAWPLSDEQVIISEEGTFIEASDTFPDGIWALVGTAFATQSDTYTAMLPTLADSTAEGINRSVYLVTTHTTTPSIWFASPPDSGYSVDNIAPGVPQGVSAAYLVSGVALDWNDASEADFQHFRVYRDTDPGFVPSLASLVQEVVASAWTDPTANPWNHYYKITVLDHAGNESEAASPESVSLAQDYAVPARTVLRGAVPNPFNPSTKLSFEMATAGHAQVKVYDTAGRLVATLVDEHRDVGRHEVIWNGRDHAGQISSAGVYLYRLEVGDFIETKRMTLVK